MVPDFLHPQYVCLMPTCIFRSEGGVLPSTTPPPRRKLALYHGAKLGRWAVDYQGRGLRKVTKGRGRDIVSTVPDIPEAANALTHHVGPCAVSQRNSYGILCCKDSVASTKYFWDPYRRPISPYKESIPRGSMYPVIRYLGFG